MYIYNKSHLPKKGWFQACFNCSQITCRTEKKLKSLEQYITFICPSCRDKVKNKELSITKLDLKIEKHVYLKKKFSAPIDRLLNRQKLNQEIKERALIM